MLIFNPSNPEQQVIIHFNDLNDLEVRFNYQFGLVSTHSDYELYSSNTFMANQLDITQLTNDQNQTLRIFINVYEYELNQLRKFYTFQQPEIIGYGKESNDKVKEGFNLALNKVYSLCHSLAIEKAKAHIQDLL